MADMVAQYNTKLTPEEERQFQDWAAQTSKAYGRDLHGDLHNYDLRGYWKSGEWQRPTVTEGQPGHMTDRWKKPNHPTFSDESTYNSASLQGGHWFTNPSGQDAFMPGPTNIQSQGLRSLADYFSRYEPGVQLAVPPQGQGADRTGLAQLIYQYINSPPPNPHQPYRFLNGTDTQYGVPMQSWADALRWIALGASQNK